MINLSIIRELCKRKHIALKTLAEDLKISPTGLSGMLKNNSTTLETLDKIANYFNVPIGLFFGETNPFTSNPDFIEILNKLFLQEEPIIMKLIGMIEGYNIRNNKEGSFGIEKLSKEIHNLAKEIDTLRFIDCLTAKEKKILAQMPCCGNALREFINLYPNWVLLRELS